jgi:hypothetical protein
LSWLPTTDEYEDWTLTRSDREKRDGAASQRHTGCYVSVPSRLSLVVVQDLENATLTVRSSGRVKHIFEHEMPANMGSMEAWDRWDFPGNGLEAMESMVQTMYRNRMSRDTTGDTIELDRLQ